MAQSRRNKRMTESRKRLGQIAGGILLLATVMVVLVLDFGRRYDGKTVKGWIHELKEGKSLNVLIALHHFGPETAVPALIDALGETPVGSSQKYQSRWRSLPSWVRSFLPRPFDLGNYRLRICEVLESFGAEARVGVPRLGKIIGSNPGNEEAVTDQFVRMAALRVIAATGSAGKDALPALWQALRREDALPVTQRALSVMNVAETIQVVDPHSSELVSYLTNWIEKKDGPEAWMKARSVDLLGKMGPAATSVVPVLIQCKESNDEALSAAAERALAALGVADR